MKDSVVIVGSARTPMGSFQGVLSGLTASGLGSSVIRAAVERSGLDADAVEEVIMGNVLPAGQGQAPARQAALGAGLPLSAGCTTINKMCGSGMKAVMLAHDLLMAGTNSVMVAGGMESMTNAPYLLPRARKGLRMGHGQVMDHMFLDGLEDAYDKGRLMGTFAEDCAEKYRFTRESQDEFAVRSLERAQGASNDGSFDAETVPVEVPGRRETVTVSRDESPFSSSIEKIPALRPAFRQDGTVTAANSSSISDGAAALLLMRESEAERRGLSPVARILGHATHAQEPAWFTTAPVGAIRQCLDRLGKTASDIDLYEINEAFAVVTMAAMHELDLVAGRVNVHGGACALGHPIGASGARILVTLLGAMRARNARVGMASLCIGGGEATAMAIERMD
ncbi:MAG: acetyl-CoA C-acyltransferase [Gammaproteobacteria bacterium]|nr:acetyl-CoA C-acyltransferase [Gammaproteobacteria bacterium]